MPRTWRTVEGEGEGESGRAGRTCGVRGEGGADQRQGAEAQGGCTGGHSARGSRVEPRVEVKVGPRSRVTLSLSREYHFDFWPHPRAIHSQKNVSRCRSNIAAGSRGWAAGQRLSETVAPEYAPKILIASNPAAAHRYRQVGYWGTVALPVNRMGEGGGATSPTAGSGYIGVRSGAVRCGTKPAWG